MKTSESTELHTVRFHATAEPNSDVYVTGSFNRWNGGAKKMTANRGEHDYYVTLMLPRGRHEYKFVVNGQYKADPECPDWVLNDFGTINSVIDVM